MEREEIRDQELDEVVGGVIRGQRYYTHVDDGGYLALRNNYNGFKFENEMGALYNGSEVIVIQDENNVTGDYVAVTVVNHVHGKWTTEDMTGRVGYVNKKFLR